MVSSKIEYLPFGAVIVRVWGSWPPGGEVELVARLPSHVPATILEQLRGFLEAAAVDVAATEGEEVRHAGGVASID